jgi:hypothetical protein
MAEGDKSLGDKSLGDKVSADKASETVSLTRKELDHLLKHTAAEAARSAAQQVTTELLANAARTEGAAPPDMGQFAALFDRMAMAIAEISDQGTSRKRVAPEILAQRAAAHKRAVERIILARERDEKPEYRLVGKVYLAERLIDPYMPGPDKRPIPTEIVWRGMPSEAMRPINEVAIEIYREFKLSVGSKEELKGQDNRPLWMTPGGVVVKGDGRAQRREITEGIPPDPFAGELDVKSDPKDPGAAYVRVLGSVHPASRQNVVPDKNQPQRSTF